MFSKKNIGNRSGIMSAFFALSLALLLFPMIISAQSVSGVTGVVTDSAGAVVPGVTVTLTDTKTSKELTTKTSDNGVYTFANIPPGAGFKITFALSGFQTYVINEVALTVNRTETYNASLAAGLESVTVEVTSSSDVTLNTTDPSIGNVITSRQLKELPIQIRNSPAALLGLQPGVVGNNVGTGATNRVGSVTGSRADQGNITIDGIDANDQATGQAFATVGNAPIDSVQEFRGTTANPTSAQGRSSGGQIELVTNSGTNDFHGSLREYNRTAATAANTFFNNKNGVEKPNLIRNQFGGSLGGPIKKDKLFFFFDYEGRRDRVGIPSTRIVPLNTFRNGFIGYVNNGPGCTPNNRANDGTNCVTYLSPAQQQAQGLDPAGIGPNAALLAVINARYPQANDLSLGDGINTGGFRFNAPSFRNDNTYTTRIDWNAADNHRVFGRLTIARRNQTDTINSVAAQFPGDPDTALLIQKDYSWVVGHTWVVNSNFTNQATVGVSHSGLDFESPFAPASPNQFTFGPISNPFAAIDTQNRQIDTPTIRDDATYTWGDHTLLFGGQIKPIKSKSSIKNDFNFVTVGLSQLLPFLDPSNEPANILVDPDFIAATNYDNAFAFLLGRIGTVNTNFNYTRDQQPLALATGKTRDYRYNEYEFYVQDNWKVRSDLNINLGVRWQYYQPPYEANGFQAQNNLDINEVYARRLANAAAGIGGAAAEPLISYDLIGKKNGGRDLYKPDYNNFGPRFGFAWNPSFTGDGFLSKILGDRKTVIRGGASLVYDRVGGGITFIQDQVTYLFDAPVAREFADLGSDPRFTGLTTLPAAATNAPPVITRPFTPFVSGGVPDVSQAGQTNYTVARDFEIPYSYQFSLGFQRELPGDFLIDVSYVGRLGRKLFSQADASQTLNFRDPASGQYLFDAFTNIQNQILNGGTAAQPFFENQVGAGGSNLIRNNQTLRQLTRIGDVSDVIFLLYANGLIDPNVGLSSQFATNAYITNLGRSNYHGALVSLQKRFSQGFQFDLNYTYSKSIDNQSSVTNTVFGGLICDLNDLKVCSGPSDFDIRHLVNANFIWELPFGKGRTFGKNAPGWLNQIIGGFSLTGIATYRSGLPFSTTTGSFPVSYLVDSPAVATGNGSAGALGGSIHDDGAFIQYFQDAAAARALFRNPRAGETGNRNALRGGSFWNADLALLKNFKLPWEGQRLQFRAEAYNVFNHHVFGLPASNFNDTVNFGRITTSASAPREMQFAIRYEF